MANANTAGRLKIPEYLEQPLAALVAENRTSKLRVLTTSLGEICMGRRRLSRPNAQGYMLLGWGADELRLDQAWFGDFGRHLRTLVSTTLTAEGLTRTSGNGPITAPFEADGSDVQAWFVQDLGELADGAAERDIFTDLPADAPGYMQRIRATERTALRTTADYFGGVVRQQLEALPLLQCGGDY